VLIERYHERYVRAIANTQDAMRQSSRRGGGQPTCTHGDPTPATE
jgi:hypothetical protein